MPVIYKNKELLHADNFADFCNWHHEGGGQIVSAPDGGMRLHCLGSQQGGVGCMAFLKQTLPDHIAVEYDIIVRSHGGLVINYLAIRGLNGEDIIDDADKLPKRTGVMADYFLASQGLQSYHVSFSRFDDDGTHTDTLNVRRNPGLLMMAQGIDPCTELGRKYRVRVCKSDGHFQFHVDGEHRCGFVDRADSACPIPDTGKFGFRLIGSDVKVDVSNFSVHRIDPDDSVWEIKDW